MLEAETQKANPAELELDGTELTARQRR